MICKVARGSRRGRFRETKVPSHTGENSRVWWYQGTHGDIPVGCYSVFQHSLPYPVSLSSRTDATFRAWIYPFCIRRFYRDSLWRTIYVAMRRYAARQVQEARDWPWEVPSARASSKICMNLPSISRKRAKGESSLRRSARRSEINRTSRSLRKIVYFCRSRRADYL